MKQNAELIMKYIYRSIFALIVLSMAFFGSCKKQPKCGCDGDVISGLAGQSVNIYYDEDANSAGFTYEGNLNARYYFCNPASMMPELTKFAQNERVLITCDMYYDCTYLMQSGNNSYYSYMYQAYACQVTKIESAIYGNN